ncbi:phosphoribosylaminoimidazolesuccinocarboxamide synthase [Prochlorococcus sp. MIT 1307]|uniref:phosphoribosylaminoimidazolesuccinocarboxamide synthase n=1 Tax=Prochlorococcus sp. MIT 1307 TaxID=3096219 RepID=UPI002A75C96C|nr:phosphoribosylaminoimidazolesuccinocarboxamide synthase [Prochlorococcus sp. MIT 1307]
MTPDHGQLLYQGKAKRIFHSERDDRVLIEFKNDATAFNALKHAELEGKGLVNCQISAHFFELLESEGIPTHYLYSPADCWIVAQRVEIVPLEVVVRNIATGSLCKETPIKQGKELSPPLLDLYYKDDDLGDPLLTEERLRRLGLITDKQRLEIENLAFRVNKLLKVFLGQLDLLLVDFKLEFGINKNGHLLVSDEISPDTCRLWDQRAGNAKDRILDKDRFRKDLGGVVDAYGEVLKRVQGVTTKPRTCS